MQDRDAADDWLRLAEAAQQAGCSIDTVRRQLKCGESQSRQLPTRHGLGLQVR